MVIKLDLHDENLFNRLKWTAREPDFADAMLSILIRLDGSLEIDEELHSQAQKLLSLIMAKAANRKAV